MDLGRSCITLGQKGRPALLFLHGFMGCKEDWLETASFFKENYFCLLPDLPGHGAAPFFANMDIPSLARALVSLLDARGYEQAVVCGYSMGGRLALSCRAQNPSLFRAMILESALPGIPGKKERNQRLEQDRRTARRLGEEETADFLDSWYALPLFKGIKETPAYTAMIRRRLAGAPGGWARALQVFSSGLQEDHGEWLSRPDIPVLYLVGEWDEKYRMLAEGLRNGTRSALEVDIMASCSHNTHLMCREQFCHRVDRFLRKYKKMLN